MLRHQKKNKNGTREVNRSLQIKLDKSEEEIYPSGQRTRTINWGVHRSAAGSETDNVKLKFFR